MTLYGIPYQGSKTKIAANIIQQLPSGERFVDLFGGGFAMSHCARLSNKWREILYNDYNPLLPPLLKDALDGKYNYNRFKPEFIPRERFYAEKGTNGYIKYIWSFGNSGSEYMFGKDVEPLKHEAHDFVVFGRQTKHYRDAEKAVTSTDIHIRRLQFCGWCKKHKGRFDLQQLEQLERLQQLERLERHITLTCGSYDEYTHISGDVVYCDPPYEGTAEYDESFDHQRFYDWVRTRPYQVWFSSYQGVKGFRLVWARQLRSSLGKGNASINFECLYTNR